jgi:hypothetical protein
MSNCWQELEDDMLKLLAHDKVKRTPLSGGTKGEEDVVGIYTLTQCKFTTDKNVSILASDLERLLKAAKLLDKLPLFVSESKAGKIVSIPITDETRDILSLALRLATLQKGLSTIEDILNFVDSEQQIKRVEADITRLEKSFSFIKDSIKEKLEKVNRKVTTKLDDTQMYNLFDQSVQQGEIKS